MEDPVTTSQLDSETNHLITTEGFTTWGEVGNGHDKQNHVCFAQDSYSVVDLVSIDLVRSLGLKPCNKKKHNHEIPALEAAGRQPLKAYGVYHLRCSITDRTGC
jgi:hypothetical protein